MDSECKNCGKAPEDAEDWNSFKFIDGDFYCEKCSYRNTDKEDKTCELCSREDVELTKHHLVPQNQEGSDEPENIAWLCVSCHRKIHATFSNYELDQFYNTVDKLKNFEEIKSYIKWIQNTDKKNVNFKQSNRSKYL